VAVVLRSQTALTPSGSDPYLPSAGEWGAPVALSRLRRPGPSGHRQAGAPSSRGFILEPEVPAGCIFMCRTVSLGICTVRAYRWPDLRGGVSASDRERPLVAGDNGPLMARRIVVRPALVSVPCFSSVLLDSCHSSDQVRRVKAREATACGLALTRRTRRTRAARRTAPRRLRLVPARPGVMQVTVIASVS
jgi:hypothetical protein